MKVLKPPAAWLTSWAERWRRVSRLRFSFIIFFFIFRSPSNRGTSTQPLNRLWCRSCIHNRLGAYAEHLLPSGRRPSRQQSQRQGFEIWYVVVDKGDLSGEVAQLPIFGPTGGCFRSENGTDRPSPPIPVELERRPEEGMGRSTFLPDLVDLRRPQRLILRFAIAEIAVEALHEAGGGVVGDAPERGEDGTGARVLEGTGEADETFASHLLAQRRITGREGHQVGVEMHALEDLPGLEEAVLLAFGRMLGQGERQGGIEREAFVEQAVAGEMDEP